MAPLLLLLLPLHFLRRMLFSLGAPSIPSSPGEHCLAGSVQGMIGLVGVQFISFTYSSCFY